MLTNSYGFTQMVDTAFNYLASPQPSPKGERAQTHGGETKRIAVITSIAGTKGLGAAPSYSATKSIYGALIG